MKFAMILLTVIGVSSCAHEHNQWEKRSHHDETANMSDETILEESPEYSMNDEVSNSQAAPAISEPVNVDRATIKQIQRKLNSLGMESGPVDGIKGPITTAALERFQDRENLDVDGDIDSQTLSALEISNENYRFAE